MSEAVLTGVHYLSGDDAAAEGLIAGGVRFFAGYPITPSSELQERISRRLPKIGGIFIQMEDELSSLAAVIGASWAGAKAATATSGPGFSLMQEHIGLAVMMEVPLVLVDVQRAGPSTGMPTYIGEGDVMQAKWGSHGSYEIIALSPSSVQECFDFCVRAVNLAEKYRVPVIVLMSETIAHIFEKVVIPPPDKIPIINRKTPIEKPIRFPYKADEDLIPPMPIIGEGYLFHSTGLTHDERGYPKMDPEVQDRLVRRLCDKIRKHADEIVDVELFGMDDARIAIVAYGITARCAKSAVRMARKRGIKAGLIRLKTVWPFPEKIIRKYAGKVKYFIVPEINYGQIVREVERVVGGKAVVEFIGKMGGAVFSPEELLDAIVKASRKI